MEQPSSSTRSRAEEGLPRWKSSSSSSTTRRLISIIACLVILAASTITIGSLLFDVNGRGAANNNNNKNDDESFGDSAGNDDDDHDIRQNPNVVIIPIDVPTEFELPLEITPNEYRNNDLVVMSTNNNDDTSSPPMYFELPVSRPDTISTLTLLSSTSNSEASSPQPLGRSYDGLPWETSAGRFVDNVHFQDCNSVSCLIDLATVDDSRTAVYLLTTFDKPRQYTDRDVAARFLEQATFGPTKESIDELVESNLDFGRWILEQQTQTQHSTSYSHRETFRRHLNAPQDQPSVVGPVTQPCQKGTRYRRTAFSEADVGKVFRMSIVTTAMGDQRRVFTIDGQIRTILPADWSMYRYNPSRNVLYTHYIPENNWQDDVDYIVCGVHVDVRKQHYNGTTTITSGKSIVRLTKRAEPTALYCQFIMFEDVGYYGTTEHPVVLSNPPILLGDGQQQQEWPERVIQLAEDDAEPYEDPSMVDLAGSTATAMGTGASQQLMLKRHINQHNNDVCGMMMTSSNPSNNVYFARWRGVMYIYDPRFQIFDNTAESPLPDGGGGVIVGLHNAASDNEDDSPDSLLYGPKCANVARTFLNEGGCYLSQSANACTVATPVVDDGDSSNPEDAFFIISHETMRTIYRVTGGGEDGTMYLYAIDGLDIEKDPDVQSPCTPGVVSRWVPVTCSAGEGEEETTMPGAMTTIIMSRLINHYVVESSGGDSDVDDDGSNRLFVDVRFPRGSQAEFTCNADDMDMVGFEVPDINIFSRCWRNVHPDHLNVYDFTQWTRDHPGNSDQRNPIKEFAEAGASRLLFPDWHDLNRWTAFKENSRVSVPLGGRVNYYRLPARYRTTGLALALGVETPAAAETSPSPLLPSNIGGPGTLVCGSPNEVANNPELGGESQRGAFDSSVSMIRERHLAKQREIAWTINVLTDPGQLRQRIAWALSQILAVTPEAFRVVEGISYTEPFLVYYDIFTRHAFGNYRDVLKEVSYSPVMATMLSYYAGQSTASVYARTGKIEYAGENYAREVMQLFTTGLFQLNQNGTQILDETPDGMRRQKLVYTNDDIEEYARAWTGFVSQEPRGNAEGDLRNTPFSVERNLIDPMRINIAWRDRLPKMGLNGMHVGDDYPLCSDLPDKHFLKQGATYYLLGKSSRPELQEDPAGWHTGEEGMRIALDTDSQLFSALCEPTGGQCSFPAKVVLDTSLECSGIECRVDTVRSVEVADGVFYEYIRPPCCHQAFFNNAKILVGHRGPNFVCGDPRIESASATCCGGNGGPVWDELFYGERTLFSSAQDRCDVNLCTDLDRPGCGQNGGKHCLDSNYFWSEMSCGLYVKINSVGKVAIVHGYGEIPAGSMDPQVNVDSQTFFRVDWATDYEEVTSYCEFIDACTPMNDGTCICEVEVYDEQVYSDVPSRDEVLSSLRVGAFDSSVNSGFALMDSDGVFVHNRNVDGSLGMNSVFELFDYSGRRQLRKNMRSTVGVKGTMLTFRNPPHFISLADPEPRDAHFETTAALDHYLFHPTTAPFLAIRFAQRFGISNPSPGYIESIAGAFRTGRFEYVDDNENLSFGAGEYGDLAATFAAVLLHPEARNVLLDADPAHGGFKEPLLKVLGLFRSLKFELQPSESWLEFHNSFGEMIGQMAHQIPSVFSFFLPEYQPSGPIAQAGLVAPEAQRLTGPRVIATMNGIYSVIKYGLNSCFGGFGIVGSIERAGNFRNTIDCSSLHTGDVARSAGSLVHHTTHEDSTTAIVDELATLMTAGRLSPKNRDQVERILKEESSEALRKAQLLIASSPEFHSTNLVRKTGQERPTKLPRTPSSKPYKVVVYVMLSGGCDSFNMLAPHSCSATNSAGESPLDQYLRLRSDLALTEEERSRIIGAEGQPCEQFGIHKDLPIVERLYNSGELTFFANTGALDVPVTKDNYYALTQTKLFAHNTMQEEARRMDPFDSAPDTGILGRMCDVLLSNGHNPQPITIEDVTVATVGGQPDSTTPMVVSSGGVETFAPAPDGEDFDIRTYSARMNDATSFHSSIYGETWSQILQKAIADTDGLADAMQDVVLTQDYTDQSAKYNKKIKTVAETILTHEARGSDRDVLYVELGGWDHHSDMKRYLSEGFQGLNAALTVFEQEMKAQGLWDQVAVVVTSDFGRTLTTNSGLGSDHAWAGNYMVMGGGVQGGQILGEYPTDLTESGPLNIGRGRLIPTLSWESVLNGVVEWMGVDTEEDLDYCMPNRHNTGTRLFSRNELFRSENTRTLRGSS